MRFSRYFAKILVQLFHLWQSLAELQVLERRVLLKKWLH